MPFSEAELRFTLIIEGTSVELRRILAQADPAVEWPDHLLRDPLDPSTAEEPPTAASARGPESPAPKPPKLPQAAYKKPIIEALESYGGEATKQQVLTWLEQHLSLGPG